VFAVALVSVLFWKRVEIAEAINRFKGGGPRTPMHPMPANDAVILARRRSPRLT